MPIEPIDHAIEHAIEPANDKDEDGGALKEKPAGPEEPPPQNPADPMFFAGLHETIKLMAQEERRRRLMSMAIV